MWFKNLVMYRFKEEFTVNPEQLEEKLDAQRFRPCGKVEMATFGWAPPVPQGTAMVHTSGHFITLMGRREEKILPASVVRDFVNDKVELLEQEQDRKIYRKEKERIKEEVLLDLLPRAFVKTHLTRAYIDTKNGWLVVDASSFKRAEELTAYLRKALGSLPIVFPTMKHAPTTVMTHWLTQPNHLPAQFELGDECSLLEPTEEGSQVSCKKQDLLSDEISQHLKSGKQVTKIALNWQDTLNCVVGSDLLIRRIRFSDRFQERIDSENPEDMAAKFDSDFTLMTLTYEQFIQQLIEALGGEEKTPDLQLTPKIKNKEITHDALEPVI